MTHCLVPEDKQIAVDLAKHKTLAGRSPVLLGGHEHELFIDEAGLSTIVKVGQDAERIGIIDIWWTADGQLRHSVQYVPANEFPKDAKTEEYAAQKAAFVEQVMAAPLATAPPHPCSTKRVRFEECKFSAFLLSLVRRACKSRGAEMAMVQGGFIRAGRDYTASCELTVGDLFAEFAFEGPFCVIRLKGEILEASCKATRESPKPAPNFLHFDDKVVITEDNRIISIDDEPFDASRIYNVAIYQHLLTGLNVIEPLFSYVKNNVTIPDAEACRPVKEMVIELCMKEAWRDLIGVDHLEGHEHEHLSPEVLQQGLDKALLELDANHDGVVSRQELEDFLRARGKNLALVERLIATLDVDGDGAISKEEFKQLVF